MIWVCPYCGTERPELRQCCGEVHSEECSDEAVEHAEKTGGWPSDIQADFDAFVAQQMNDMLDAYDKETP